MLPLRRSSSRSVCRIMRAPVAANGWPIAIEPPFTLSLRGVDLADGSDRPSFSSANSFEANAFRLREHLRGEGLVHLDEVHVRERRPARSSATGAA